VTGFVVNLERNGAGDVAARQKIPTRYGYTSATIGVFAPDNTGSPPRGAVSRRRAVTAIGLGTTVVG
jgi:hypothetical protein